MRPRPIPRWPRSDPSFGRLAGFVLKTPICQPTHSLEVIRQGLVPPRPAPGRIVLRFLPAQRPWSQPLGDLEVGSGLDIGIGWSRSTRCHGPLGPLVHDGLIDPGRDQRPLVGRWVFNR